MASPHIPLLTSVLALSVVEAVRAVSSQREEDPAVKCEIKWPNDIICNNHKIGGILSECSMDNSSQQFEIMLGLGLNVNTLAEQLSGIARPRWPASSLLVEAGSEWPKDDLQDAICDCFNLNMGTFLDVGATSLVQRLCEVSILNGKRLRFVTSESGEEQEAVFCGLDDGGGLIVDVLHDNTSTRRVLHSAEILAVFDPPDANL
eukprot:TRINITY_DN52944_c0_g1_i1.p1 TRINITY_DN52944_c0_g1~~TRINITY_DN52944_c0_g1_i1.p1  ORF type:complete len:204 (-),score=42.71 TRINITY_DN52944_c0_g1_i1:95-706(-)